MAKSHTREPGDPGSRVPTALVRIAAVLLVIYLAIVAVLVFEPVQGEGANVVLVWLTDAAVSLGASRDAAFTVLEVVLNVVMFVPLGVLLPILARRLTLRVVLPVAVAGLALTLVIEFAQVYIPGRYSHPSDLAANTLGAALGALIIVACRGLVTRR